MALWLLLHWISVTGKKKPEKNQGVNGIRTRDLAPNVWYRGGIIIRYSSNSLHCSSIFSLICYTFVWYVVCSVQTQIENSFKYKLL